jgi:protease secretion system outer membrane protein
MLLPSMRFTRGGGIARLATLALGGCLTWGVAAAQDKPAALTLAQAYDAALRNDVRYQMATKELESARLAVPVVRAGLLPQLAFSASVSKVKGTRDFGNALNQDVRVPLNYEAPQYGLSLRAPVFNYEALVRLRQATSTAEGAEAMMQARHLDLVSRLTTAYLEVLMQHEALRLAAEELQSLLAQAERARRRYTLGEGTVQDATAAEAAAEIGRTRLARSRDDVVLALQSLQRVTGMPASTLRTLPADFAGVALPLPDLQAWMSRALQSSPILRFRELSVETARHGVDRQRAGHYPRLDVVASLSRAENESVSTLNQATRQRSVGVQLSVPLYSGGGVEAGIAQAVAEKERVQEELRAERENLLFEVERLYRLAYQGPDRLSAHAQALGASEVAVQAADRAQAKGLGTAADYRLAVARRAAAQRDLIQARYEYVNQYVQLLVVSGWTPGVLVNEMAGVLTRDAEMDEGKP